MFLARASSNGQSGGLEQFGTQLGPPNWTSDEAPKRDGNVLTKTDMVAEGCCSLAKFTLLIVRPFHFINADNCPAAE